jgi:ketosteroid isomerase-like protein
MLDLAPDARQRAHHVRLSARGLLASGMWFGTRDGGAFEIPGIVVSELDADGKLVRQDVYDVEQPDAAWARFDELRPDATRIPPNTATRMSARWQHAFDARDWDAMRALTSDDFVYDDRTKRSLVRGDVETWITSLQFANSWPAARIETELLGTLGDWIAVERVALRGGGSEDAVELMLIRVLEVDVAGRVRAIVLFDPENRGEVWSETTERFAAGEAAASAALGPYGAFTRAFQRHDWDAMRQVLAPDLVLGDHRPLGLGRLDREQWIASMQALAELSPDMAGEASQTLAWNRHGLVVANRIVGTVPNGGGPFENVFVTVVLTAGNHIAHFEVFPITDAERALARFAELCANQEDSA